MSREPPVSVIDRSIIPPTATVHHLPCHIALDGAAKVSAYFVPTRPLVDGGTSAEKKRHGQKACSIQNNVLERLPHALFAGPQHATFRGRLLEGYTAQLPPQYTGMVLRESRLPGGVFSTGSNVAGASTTVQRPASSAAGASVAHTGRGVSAVAARSSYGRKAAAISSSDSDDGSGSSSDDDDDAGCSRFREAPRAVAPVIAVIGGGGGDEDGAAAAANHGGEAAGGGPFTWPRRVFNVEAEFDSMTYW
jgi:hypothetical protein